MWVWEKWNLQLNVKCDVMDKANRSARDYCGKCLKLEPKVCTIYTTHMSNEQHQSRRDLKHKVRDWGGLGEMELAVERQMPLWWRMWSQTQEITAWKASTESLNLELKINSSFKTWSCAYCLQSGQEADTIGRYSKIQDMAIVLVVVELLVKWRSGSVQ